MLKLSRNANSSQQDDAIPSDICVSLAPSYEALSRNYHNIYVIPLILAERIPVCLQSRLKRNPKFLQNLRDSFP